MDRQIKISVSEFEALILFYPLLHLINLYLFILIDQTPQVI